MLGTLVGAAALHAAEKPRAGAPARPHPIAPAKGAAKQPASDRVVLRRLNRVEYENTVRDLFAVRISVKEILPEDTVSHGFDNVGAALNVSPALIERYLEASDAVLDAAVAPVHRLESTTRRFDLYDSLPDWFWPRVWRQEDGVVLFSPQNESATSLEKFRAPAPGRYRFRISASTHNATSPLPLAVLLGYFNVTGNPIQHHGYLDVPPGPPTTLEFEHRILAKNDTLKLGPVDMPFVYLNQKNMPAYPGPGLKVHWVEIEGPLPEQWPSESYRRVFGEVDPKTGTLEDAEKLLRALLPRTFRRPIAAGEEKPYVAIVDAMLKSGQSFEASLRAGIKGVLASPKFLYFREPAGPLDDYALASRLSYFFWSTMPDETLFSLARKGELHRPEVLRAQVERMLADPRAAAFTENFTGQWLGLRNIDATTPDKKLYPEYEELLQWSSVRETHLFFDELLKENLSVRNFVDSDFAMLNGRLARHYGIPGVEGVAFRKVPLKPEYHRGGVLTQASILKVTANGTSTSPVVRGVWVLDRLLGRPASLPPANVPAIEPDIRGATTIREQLSKHRESPACAGCHARIDPPGFALENYDAIGGWRERYRIVTDRDHWVKNRVGPLAPYLAAWQYGVGKPVEAGDTLPDGRRFADLAELKKLLLAQPDQIARCVTEKLVTYATGQPVGDGDRKA
ncbi:MAG: Planctomycete cytochrome, partial [Armatimonadetes bacterium]|nr:Planctomycete cytochrome [Armatimonadota bacterium]